MSSLTTKDIYSLSTKQPEYGIQGYCVAKTTNYSSRESKFPKDTRKDLAYESRVHSKEPDPTKYNESYEKSVLRYWTTPNGKFLKSKKKSIMEEASDKGKETPGPGAYNKEPARPKSSSGGFGKGERLSYLSSVEFYSGETPCSWKYSPAPAKGMNKKGWSRPVTAKKTPKEAVGPGKYTDGLDKAYKKTHSSSVSHSFSKSKEKSGSIYEKVNQTKFVPGVGAYKDVEKAFSGYHVVKRSRATVILPYKAKGFTDDIVKRSKETPGPGAYYVGPPIKVKK